MYILIIIVVVVLVVFRELKVNNQGSIGKNTKENYYNFLNNEY